MALERGDERTVDIIVKAVTRADQRGVCTAEVLIPAWHIEQYPLKLGRIPQELGESLHHGLGSAMWVVLARENARTGKEGSPNERDYFWGLSRIAASEDVPAATQAATFTPGRGPAMAGPAPSYQDTEAIKRISIERQQALAFTVTLVAAGKVEMADLYITADANYAWLRAGHDPEAATPPQPPATGQPAAPAAGGEPDQPPFGDTEMEIRF